MTTTILAFDPGRSTGWAVVRDGRLAAHGTVVHPTHTRHAKEAFEAAWRALDGRPPDVAAVEMPIVSRGKGGLGRAASSMSVGARHGFLVGALWAVWQVTTWDPTAAQWRAVIGLGRGGSREANARDAVNARVWSWAVDAVKEAGTRPGIPTPLRMLNKWDGEQLLDEANAIALAFAALERHRLASSLLRADSSGRRRGVAESRRRGV